MNYTLHHGDCLDILCTLPDNSVDAIVTDPPYGLSFMGKRWDYDVPSEDIWRECLRVLKPGGHLLAFAGTRTQHRMAVRIEDAGFEIRDMIAWVYGSGFPKSLDVSKAIDKQRVEDLQPAADVARWLVDRLTERGMTRKVVTEHFGAANIAQQWTTHWTDGAVKPRVPRWEQWLELKLWLDLPDCMDADVWRLNGRKGQPGEAYKQREVVKVDRRQRNSTSWDDKSGMLAYGEQNFDITAPATPAARQWQGWGTALKPALEPITVARKPLIGTVAENVLTWGTGGVNVDGCRVEMNDYDREEYIPNRVGWKDGAEYASSKPCVGSATNFGKEERGRIISDAMLTSGRWPANLIHDGSEEVVGLFPESKGAHGGGINTGKHGPQQGGIYGQYNGFADKKFHQKSCDSGSAARFFYCAKASKRDRDEGCEGMPQVMAMRYGEKAQGPLPQQTPSKPVAQRNHHPTVKPTDLMRYLCRLVTPPVGTVLDPFMGSGSTGKAAVLEDFDFIGIEREAEYLDIARARIEHAINNKPNRLL